MRVSYLPPTESDFDEAFSVKLRGGSLGDIRIYQPRATSRGGSFLGILGSIAKTAMPFLRRIFVPEIGRFARDVVRDVSRGKKVRDTLKSNGLNALKRTAKRVVRGAGRKKGKKLQKERQDGVKKRTVKRCKKFRDIFSKL